jgi:hypothetical protein
VAIERRPDDKRTDFAIRDTLCTGLSNLASPPAQQNLDACSYHSLVTIRRGERSAIARAPTAAQRHQQNLSRSEIMLLYRILDALVGQSGRTFLPGGVRSSVSNQLAVVNADGDVS